VNKFELHLEVNEPTHALDLIAQHCSLSRAEIKMAISKGALWLTKANQQGKAESTQRLRRIKKALTVNDQLHFYYDSQVLQQIPNQALLIADQQTYSIWYKPYGMLCQGSKWSDHCTINRWAEVHLSRPAFIVHRLDRAATGLIIIAHSKSMAQAFSRMFEQHELQKCYQIIVHGDLREQAQPSIVTSEIDGKTAYSEFLLIDYCPERNQSLLAVNIKTGRKHQIRIHSSRLGFPIVGDRLYGQPDNESAINLQLCAVSLTFNCPVTQVTQQVNLTGSLRPKLAQQ